MHSLAQEMTKKQLIKERERLEGLLILAMDVQGAYRQDPDIPEDMQFKAGKTDNYIGILQGQINLRTRFIREHEEDPSFDINSISLDSARTLGPPGPHELKVYQSLISQGVPENLAIVYSTDAHAFHKDKFLLPLAAHYGVQTDLKPEE